MANYIHNMPDFCGFDAVNGIDSGRKPLCGHKRKKEKISLWRLSSTFVLALETKFHFLSATDALLGGKFSTSPRKGPSVVAAILFLRVSRRKWYRCAPKLPLSYLATTMTVLTNVLITLPVFPICEEESV